MEIGVIFLGGPNLMGWGLRSGLGILRQDLIFFKKKLKFKVLMQPFLNKYSEE
jgi:hypothetical protein